MVAQGHARNVQGQEQSLPIAGAVACQQLLAALHDDGEGIRQGIVLEMLEKPRDQVRAFLGAVLHEGLFSLRHQMGQVIITRQTTPQAPAPASGRLGGGAEAALHPPPQADKVPLPPHQACEGQGEFLR